MAFLFTFQAVLELDLVIMFCFPRIKIVLFCYERNFYPVDFAFVIERNCELSSISLDKAINTLREWFSRSKRYGTSFSLVYFDLNGLKLVNDKYGHQAGDLLLRSVVGVVKKLLRDSDVLFRMGGDEFMVLCPDTDRQGALTCAERMQNAVSGITIVDQSVTFAYGIAHSSEDYKDMDDMLHSADASMYECKKQMHAGRK